MAVLPWHSVSNVKIGDKIGDHQTVYFSTETEKESTALEKYNFNFRRANFDAMHDKHVILERLIEGTDAAQGFEIFKNRVNDASSQHIPRKRITMNDPSRISNDVKSAIARRQRVYQTSKFTTLKNQLPNMPQQNAKWKEVWNKPNVAGKQTLQRSVEATRNASTRMLMKEE